MSFCFSTLYQGFHKWKIFAKIRESYSFVIRQNWRNIREYIREYSRIFTHFREYIHEYSRIFPNIREYSRNCLSIISSFCTSKWRKMRWRKMMEENDNLCIWIKQFLFFLFTCYMYMSWQLNEYIHWNSDVSCRKSKKNLWSKISGKRFPEFVLSIFLWYLSFILDLRW